MLVGPIASVMLAQERSDGPRFDAGILPEPPRNRVLHRQPEHSASFLGGDRQRRLQHRRFASASHALNRDNPIRAR